MIINSILLIVLIAVQIIFDNIILNISMTVLILLKIIFDFKKENTEKIIPQSDEYNFAKNQNEFLSKLTKLEYKNTSLEKKVMNLFTVNAIGKSIVSELDFEKIIDIVLDSYSVIINSKRIAFYFWIDEKLEKKRDIGGTEYSNDENSNQNISILNDSNYEDKYIDLAKTIHSVDEKIYVLPVIFKSREFGVIYLISDLEDTNLQKEEIQLCTAITNYLAIAIYNSKMYKMVAQKEKMEKELSLAADIQKNLLPNKIKEMYGLKISHYFKPAKIIGGDYYDYYNITDKKSLGIIVGDVSGKGMPAALLMALMRSIIKTLISYEIKPDKILSKLNRLIYNDINNEMFITVFLSIYDDKDKTLYYSNAGHNPLLYYNKEDNLILEKNVKGTAIGFVKNYNNKFDKQKLKSGDILVYYTDGITEARNNNGDLFGQKRLEKIIYENKDKSSSEIKDEVIKEVYDYVNGGPQSDDMTLIIIKKD
ncbi:MAG: GAF domain-containing SpoIIE family protein phosphatase [Fusobacteriota bacterium]